MREIARCDWMACLNCIHNDDEFGGCAVDDDEFEDGLEYDKFSESIICGCFFEKEKTDGML
jgi:hypothetical protein